MSDLEKIVRSLPPASPFWLRCEADYYGASNMLASRLGRSSAPVSFASWRHGWVPFVSEETPELYALGRPTMRNLVANEYHVDILQKHGYNNVEAIGLPYIYLDHNTIPKLPNSLLVMPGHTHEKSTQSWNEKEFVESVQELRDRFDWVLACLHPVCAERGYWIDSFEKAGIPWILGGGRRDRNALYRIRDLLSVFEYVSTNTIGSHIPYAAWSGAKIFFSGNYDSPRYQDFSHDPFYMAHPKALEVALWYSSEKQVRKRFPWLFVTPDEAENQFEWAYRELGGDVKRSEDEVAKLLGWTVCGQLTGYSNQSLRFITNPRDLWAFITRTINAKHLLKRSNEGVRYFK